MDGDATASAPAAAESAPAASEPVAATSGERVTVPVPIMGESITTGSLADWSVGVGDSVDVDQVVAVIDTDKVWRALTTARCSAWYR